MTPGYLTGMPDDRSLEKQIEKQMGCMAGFRQLFDRHQILAGKRLHAAKRLPASSAVDSSFQSENIAASQALSKETKQSRPAEVTKPAIGDNNGRESKGSPSPELRCAPPVSPPQPVELSARLPLPIPAFEFKEGLRSSWKLREAPRLSLDSRAIVDGKGSVFPREIRTNAAIFAAGNRDMSSQADEENEKQRRSPSVIARLMGLEALPDSGREPPKNAELRRSASESRVSRDMMQYRFLDGNGFQNRQPPCQKIPTSGTVRCSAIQEDAFLEEMSKDSRMPDPVEIRSRASKCVSAKDPVANGSSPWNMRKSFFDSQDFFPEPRRTGSLYGEIEKRLKMRGIDEPAKDLETLKQILEALHLKGLLHTKKSVEPISGRRNLVYDRQFAFEEAPIVVMKPARSPGSTYRQGRSAAIESRMANSRSKAGIRRSFVTEPQSPVRQRRDRFEIDRNLQSERRSRNSSRPSDASDGGAKSPSSLARRNLSVETQKRGKDFNDRRTSSCISPKNTPKKVASGSDLASNRSSRIRKQTAEISPKDRISSQTEDESSTISESSISASSQIDCELQRMKMEEYKEGRSLLERCDKLLHSIAEITAIEQQPSPVSVLDSSLYKEDSSPSPVMKRCIEFKADHQSVEAKEDWSPAISPVRSSKPEEESDDVDLLYLGEILSHKWEETDSDLFAFLEKQHHATNRKNYPFSSKASRLHRRLLFDTVTEILDRKKAFLRSKCASSIITVDQQALVRQIWSELVRIRERPQSDDICDVLAKDLARGEGMDGWGDRSVELSEAVLDIERLIFKDLVSEAIRDLACSAGKCTPSAPPRRKLAF